MAAGPPRLAPAKADPIRRMGPGAESPRLLRQETSSAAKVARLKSAWPEAEKLATDRADLASKTRGRQRTQGRAQVLVRPGRLGFR
jgi:hypothetical protein